MRQLLDGYGRQVSLGSTVVYAVKHSSSVSINYGYVYSLKIDSNNRYSLGIVALSKTWRGNTYTYKTALTANNFIVCEIPADIKEQLMKLAV